MTIEPRFLQPLDESFTRKEIWVFDIESKNDHTQEMGFTRPFLLGFWDGEVFRAFQNMASLGGDWRTRHIEPGGLVDQFMHYVLGDYPGGDPTRYQSDKGAIYSHNGGNFDELFILNWLCHQQRYHFEISSVQSRIQRLDVWPAGQDKKEGFWSFLDSVCLLPMTLKKIGDTFCPETAGKMAMDLNAPERTLAVEATARCTLPLLPELYGVIRKQKAYRCVSDPGKFDVHEQWQQGEEAIIGGILHRAIRASTGLVIWEPVSAIPWVVEPGDTIAFTQWPSHLPSNAFGNEPFDLWEMYNRIDCEVLRQGLLNFSDLMARLGTDIGVTTPSTSMKLFRRKFQEGWIPRNAHFASCDGRCRRTDGFDGRCARVVCDGLCHGCAHDFIRRGFYGGRTEKFEDGAKEVFYFDLNSSYPAVMQFDMPVGRMQEMNNITWKMARRMAKKNVGFLECTVEIPPGKCLIPPLPYRTKGGECLVDAGPGVPKRKIPAGKLIFPVGRFSGVWDFEELQMLFHPLVGGKILKIKRTVWYKKSPIFRKMVQTLYRYRKKHARHCTCKDPEKEICNPLYSPGMSETAKLSANAFFGKTGMREERTSLVFLPPGEDFRAIKDGWPIDGEPETCRIWEVERVASAPYVMPQFAAHITSMARVRLFMGMCDVLQRGGRVLYCDTDSIIATIPLSDYLIDSNILGKWKNEHPGVKVEGLFVLPKLYQLRFHKQTCTDDSCLGCAMVTHRPTCKDKKCKGCWYTKQRMKGFGGNPSAEMFADAISRDPSRAVPAERVVKHKTMLKQHLLHVTALKDNRLLGGQDDRAKKIVRTYYDKRVMDARGRSRPIVLNAA